mmetsp:Transcript_21621/g.42235  ORF Transcript_21621/g.42235 Transcript_21621/m.42235 type:complete len:220 (-) Transcript_21621:910-1569(-)
MEYVALLNPFHVQDSLHAIHLLWVTFENPCKEVVQSVLIQRSLKLHAQSLDVRVMNMVILIIKERRIKFQSFIKRECSNITQVINWNWLFLVLQVHGKQLCIWIHVLQLLCHAVKLLFCAEVRLSQQQPVRKGNLLCCFIHAGIRTEPFQLGQHMLCIADPQNGVQTVVFAHELVKKKGGGNWRRVCKPGGLDENSIQVAPTSPHIFEDFLHTFNEVTS